MWEHMNIGVDSMWSNPYMLIFWVLSVIGAVVLGVVIARTLPHHRGHHDDTLPHH